MPHTHKSHHTWKPIFLKTLAQTGLVPLAAEKANISPTTAYRARDTAHRTGAKLLEAQNFARDWDLALEKFSDSVEVEIKRRAIDGIERQTPIYYKGDQVGTRTIRVYSDRLLMFMAKALRPKRYGPHSNTPDQFRFATPVPDSNLLDEARERTKQRWTQLVPFLLNLFGSESAPQSADNLPPLADNQASDSFPPSADNQGQ